MLGKAPPSGQEGGGKEEDEDKRALEVDLLLATWQKRRGKKGREKI